MKQFLFQFEGHENTLHLETCNEGHAIAIGGMERNSTVDTECTSFKRMVDAHVAFIIVQRVSLFNGTHNKAKETKHLSNGIKTQSRKNVIKMSWIFYDLLEPFSEEKELKAEQKTRWTLTLEINSTKILTQLSSNFAIISL